MQTMARDVVMALGQAVVGGLLVAVFAFAACRLLRRLTAPVRFVIWWLVGAKFLVVLAFALLGVTALRIPVLKAEHYYRLTGLARNTVARAGRLAPVPPAPVPAEASGDVPFSPSPQPAKHVATFTGAVGVSSIHSIIERVMAPWYLPLLALYGFGVAVSLARSLRGTATMRRLIRESEVCEHAATLAEAHAMAWKIGVRRELALSVSMRSSVPFVIGTWCPRIVLPAAFLAERPEARRMVLAHEIAHIRRGDILLESVPFLLRALFWFLPPAYAIAGEIAAAREEACDILAVKASDTPPAVYASVLISVAERARVPVPALAMASPCSPGYRQIKRRLRTLSMEASSSPVPLVWRGVAAALVTAQCAATLLPLRPVLARAAEAARTVLPAPGLPVYTVTDLGTLGGRESDAVGINDAGQVVGTAHVFPLGTRGHAFLWDGHPRDLTAGSVYRHSRAVAIAGNSAVVGFAYRTSYRSGQQNAFVWKGKRRIYLPPASGFRYARAVGVADSGAVVGASLGGGSDPRGATVARATLWQDNRTWDLGTLGGAYSAALAVNASGIVVGKADLPDDAGGSRRTRPFVWNSGEGGMRDLGTLGGDSGAACAVSQSGVVVGYAQTGTGAVHAFATTARGGETPRDLGVLAGYERGAAFAVNDGGAIVGEASGAGGTRRAVLWVSLRSAPVDLNECLVPSEKAVWVLETARGINGSGSIVGQGVVGGKRHAVLLTPK